MAGSLVLYRVQFFLLKVELQMKSWLSVRIEVRSESIFRIHYISKLKLSFIDGIHIAFFKV